jgi:glycosyltransferase involved in cell wall biosynthesis
MTQFDAYNPPVSTEPASPREPAVSVVIPAYDAARYIAGTLQSVFAQSFSDYEILLVNDGSPDTEMLEEKIQPYLCRIRYFKQANRGPSAARNLAIREAEGRYVAFLDADDFWLPSHLARQIQRLNQNPKLGLVYANAFHLRGDTVLGTAFDHVPQSGTADLDSLLSERCTINTSSVVVLRSALLQAGLFEESMKHCEDFDLWLRVAKLGFTAEYDREVQVGHRLGKGLAASRELMKKGRARAYERFLESGKASDSQRTTAERKLKELDFELHTELAKRYLLEKRYPEALVEVKLAGSTAGKTKLLCAKLGLLCFPSGFRVAYRAYTNVLGLYKKRTRTQAVKTVSYPDLARFLATSEASSHPND